MLFFDRTDLLQIRPGPTAPRCQRRLPIKPAFGLRPTRPKVVTPLGSGDAARKNRAEGCDSSGPLFLRLSALLRNRVCYFAAGVASVGVGPTGAHGGAG